MMKNLKQKAKKLLYGSGTTLAVVLSTVSTLLCFSITWMFDTWSNLTMDELVYHLTAPMEGTNESMIQDYLTTCVTPAILVLLLMLILFMGLKNKRTNMYTGVMIAGLIVPLIASGSFISHAWSNLDISTYVEGQGSYSRFIDDNYIDPSTTEITFPEQKRNLIYIFLESMETTYADTANGGAFEENAIPDLTKLAQENEDFSGDSTELNGGYAMPGATWTIGAMFAQTSGLPLSISIESNSMDTQDSFFAGAVTLGDILKQEGYSQSLMIGSDAVFGGRQLYFTEHGDYDMLDYNYALKSGMLPEDYRVWWGYEDEKLFGFAEDKLIELSQEGGPFNFSLLTVDTHFEDGYLCPQCPTDFENNQYANVMSCSSRQVAAFISWIQQQSFYENTTIVISGDHPTMDSDFCADVDESYTRKVYTTYINSAVENQTTDTRNYTTFDNFPTTLASMGVKIDGDRLGLGTNLFSEKPTLTERFGIENTKKEISRKSQLMESLANLNENKPELLIREGKVQLTPTADVAAGPYNGEEATFPITVSNLANVETGVESVLAAVWSEEDQSDLQWIPMEPQEDGTYYLTIDVGSYNYRTGDYRVHIYMTDVHGESTFLKETIVPVN